MTPPKSLVVATPVERMPLPSTARPVPAITAPLAAVVAIGRSAATNATVLVIWPCASYVIPLRVLAPPATALLTVIDCYRLGQTHCQF